MFNSFRFSLGQKIYGLIALSLAGLIVASVFTLNDMATSLRAQKQVELTHLGELALAIVKEEYAAMQSGALTQDAAQQRAAARLSAVRYGHDDYFWINDLQPRMVMHPMNPALNGKDLSGVRDPNGKALFVAFVDVVKTDGAGFVSYEWPKPGADKPQPKLSRVVGFAPWGWVIGTGVYIDDLAQQTWDATRNIMIVSILVLLAVGPVSVFVARRMSGGIASITRTMMHLAAGEMDIELPTILRRDELGEMASVLTVFKSGARENRRLLAEQGEAEVRAAEDRRLAGERQIAERKEAAERQDQATKEAMRDLVKQFEAAVSKIIGVVSVSAGDLEAGAGKLANNARSTERLSGEVAAASEQASANVRSVASGAEQMNASVLDISRQVQFSNEIARRAVSQAEQTDARVNALSKAASRIGDVVKLITDVAEQTNLLALNATIEAARAGEAGKGFAVVAQEVKALAAQTAKATGEIGSQIAGMQAATNESVTAIKEIGATIGRMSEIAGTIASAVEQQGSVARGIAHAVGEAARGTSLVSDKIRDVNRQAVESGQSSGDVLASAQSLAAEGNHLTEEMARFLDLIGTDAGRSQQDRRAAAG